jgi:DNA repair exonuclease SbcCD ATPase subunit
MNKSQQFRTKLEQQKGRCVEIEQTISKLEEEIQEKEQDLIQHEQALAIIREVGLATQQQLQFHISNITTLALEAVFDDPYELLVKFVERRSKTECDLLFTRDGHEVKPLDASGFGVVDVAAFALRIASWSMGQPHSRNVILLDEPFKCLKGQRANSLVLDMISEISKKLNLQIIMIGDERIDRDEIIAKADRVFEITKHKGKSQVEILT